MKEENKEIISFINHKLDGERYGELIKEILELVSKSSIEDELENKLLCELYRFLSFSNAITSLDSRGDTAFKTSPLYNIKNALINNDFKKENVEILITVNNACQRHFLKPWIIEKESREFRAKNPGARF